MARWRTVAGLVLAVLCLVTAGCSSDAAFDSDLRLQLQRSIAAVQSQSMALHLRTAGGSTSAVTQVVCTDAAEEVASAQETVATRTVDNPGQTERRDAALEAITDAVAATTTSRDGACRGPGGPRGGLDAALDGLQAVRDRLGAGR